ncbi:hypothetical protein H5410_012224 [Solanum commersonii]|uniref:Uncharacterized protein n=1 Tax=Solanum commersonii TaxID=4109 RepID=A0A9J6AR06_SOLCO|nr:hypothetical protein H5410_012224 [Solanum commersonii]
MHSLCQINNQGGLDTDAKRKYISAMTLEYAQANLSPITKISGIISVIACSRVLTFGGNPDPEGEGEK